MCIRLVLKGKRGWCVDVNTTPVLFSTGMNTTMVFHFVICHHVCFVMTNESRVASSSLVLFSARPINDPVENNVLYFVCLPMTVT